MKKSTLSMVTLTVVAVALMALAGAAYAQSISPKDLGKMKADIEMLNSYKNIPQAERIIPKKFSDTFKVNISKVNALIGNMQYGDAAATLAFADRMKGGTNDANISTVANMKRSAGWDQVAKNLSTQVNVSDVANKLSSVDDEMFKSIRQAMADAYIAGMAAGGTGS